MQKEELLSAVTQSAKENIITLDELEDAYRTGIKVDTDILSHKKLGIADVLYLVGGLIIVIGISVLVGENWAKLGPILRVLVTLGASAVTFVAGYLISKKNELAIWSVAFYLISSITMPVGFYILFDSMGIFTDGIGREALVAGLVWFVHILAFWKLRKGVHLIFSLLYGVWFYYLAIVFFYGQRSFNTESFSFITIVLGVSLMSLGVGISVSEFRRLAGLVFTASTFMILGSCLALQGFGSDASFFWEGIYPVICFVLIFLSAELKSKAVLAVSTLMLMVYIMKITGEYFAESLGWPLALVIAGLLLMAVGYFAFYLNKRQLQKKEQVILPSIPTV